MKFQDAFLQVPVLLTEGAVLERLRRDPTVKLDPYINHAGFVYAAQQRRLLAKIHRRYLDIGHQYDLPMVVQTPTWRASQARVARSEFSVQRFINEDGVAFINTIRAGYGKYAQQIFIAGLMACQGDAYRPEEALSADEAERIHASQVRALDSAGVDFILGATLPAISEAIGMIRAAKSCCTPFVAGFVIRSDGCVLDGTPLDEAIHRIDHETDGAPLFFMVNCVHPSVLTNALEHLADRDASFLDRLSGFQANTSAKSPEELNGLAYLDSEAPESYAEAVAALHDRFGIKMIGGCCGSDERHIDALARKVSLRYKGISTCSEDCRG